MCLDKVQVVLEALFSQFRNLLVFSSYRTQPPLSFWRSVVSLALDVQFFKQVSMSITHIAMVTIVWRQILE